MKLQPGPLIGQGNTADVFDLGDNKVVKLYHAGFYKGAIETEWENSKLLNHLNIPIAKSYEMVAYEDRYGIVYDKLQGVSLLDLVLQPEKTESCTMMLAQMHKKLLNYVIPAAVSYKTILHNCIQSTDQIKENSKVKLLEILATLPEGEQLCHGDFHYGNLLLVGQDCYVIDYMNVCKGHRNLDIARTFYLIDMTSLPQGLSDYEMILRMKKQQAELYLREMGVNKEELSNWLIVIAAARLAELNSNLMGEKETILEFLSTRLRLNTYDRNDTSE